MSSRQLSHLQSNEAVLLEVEHYNYRAVDCNCIVFNSPTTWNLKISPSNANDHKLSMCVERTRCHGF